MVHLNRRRQYSAIPWIFTLVQRLQPKAMATAVQVWSILLVLGENKARNRRVR
jgi:hypothetical protein